MARPALDVANHFIECSAHTKTNLQIMKLTYISHGYMLALHDRPLITDRVEAWDHGPVIPPIWRAFKKWGSRVIEHSQQVQKPFDSVEAEVLRGVFKHYGKYCGYYLSQITHHDADLETPWHQCYVKGANEIIHNDITKEYYKQLIR